MTGWMPIESRPEFDEQPGRQFILVEGWCTHHGSTWRRVYADTAFIRKDEPFGYRPEDLERIRKDGDMDGIDRVTHWAPAIFPSFPAPPAQETDPS